MYVYDTLILFSESLGELGTEWGRLVAGLPASLVARVPGQCATIGGRESLHARAASMAESSGA